MVLIGMKRLFNVFGTITLLCLVFTPINTQAAVIQEANVFSGSGMPVRLRAELTILDDILTVELSNLSTVSSPSPDDLLSSYFFDIVGSGGNRPSMTYLAATGDVYLTAKDYTDLLWQMDADLKAENRGDGTWQYKVFDLQVSDFIGFGLGTVGNSDLSPNNFNGNIVSGMDYSIYAGDITTRNLSDRLLVKSGITFTFSGLTGFTEADVAAEFAFGLGTAPDSFVAVPEPATIVIMTISSLFLVLKKRKQ